jgi:hypothetical protein
MTQPCSLYVEIALAHPAQPSGHLADVSEDDSRASFRNRQKMER